MTALMTDFPLLSLLLLMLPLGALLTGLIPWLDARWAALTTALLVFAVTIVVVVGFDPTQMGFQFVENSPWMPGLGIYYRLGVDGLSVLFLPFTALLFVAVILASWNAIRTLPCYWYWNAQFWAFSPRWIPFCSSCSGN